jgi:16S rRNA (cytosine1402-N4)-methyltransferase
MTVHIPVLMREVLEWLEPQPDWIIVDGTLGGGGHAGEFLTRLGVNGRVLGMDRDPGAVERTSRMLDDSRLLTLAANYADLPEYLSSLGIEKVNAILLDLGLSSDQLADRDRGFSFQSDGTLDLRFDQTAGEPAWRLVNRLSEKHLANLIYEYGEERLSRRVARKIVAARRAKEIRTASQLATIVRSCVGRSRHHSIDPATRTFQALRIAVNEELKWLKVAMKRLPECLAPHGRLGVISFHSLEDRIVKHSMVENAGLDVLTKKPIRASEEEKQANPRSRSAKFRVAEKR